MNMIELVNVTKRYPNGHEALRQVNFAMAAGQMAFITGHSGAGKSTFLKLIGLLERTNRGKLLVNGEDLINIKKNRIPLFRRSVGFVLQNPHLLPEKNIFANVALPLKIEGYSKTETERYVRAALDKVGLLSKEKYLSEELSAGEQQRVGMARAIVNRPTLILADEPTGNLDPALSEQIIELFEDFNRTGSTVLIASHDVNLIHKKVYPIHEIAQGRFKNDVVMEINDAK
jgi:cell division transport system ATP-binding protein